MTGGALDSPVEDMLATVRRSQLLLVAVHVPMVGFLVAMGSTGLGLLPAGEPLLAVPAGLALGAIELRLGLALARGERPTMAIASFLATLALCVGPWLVLGGDHWATSLWFVAAAGAMAFTRRARVVAFAAAMVAMLVTSIVEVVALDVPASTVFWGGFLYGLTISLMGGAVLYGAPRLTRIVDELFQTRAALEDEAAGGERLRVSRDLHDMLGQSLSAVSLKGDLALRLLDRDPEAAAAEARDIAQLATAMATHMREVAEDKRAVSLATEAAGAVELLHAVGIDATVKVGVMPLAPTADTLLGWAVREGVTNVLRHSDARRCQITATNDDRGQVRLDVENDGVSTDRNGAGHGLAGLADRAQAADGTLSADRIGADRFRLRVVIPKAVA